MTAVEPETTERSWWPAIVQALLLLAAFGAPVALPFVFVAEAGYDVTTRRWRELRLVVAVAAVIGLFFLLAFPAGHSVRRP